MIEKRPSIQKPKAIIDCGNFTPVNPRIETVMKNSTPQWVSGCHFSRNLYYFSDLKWLLKDSRVRRVADKSNSPRWNSGASLGSEALAILHPAPDFSKIDVAIAGGSC
jgi:hypothetical protein